MKTIVQDYRILKALERRGFIVTRDGTSRHWTGLTVRNYFVREGPNLRNWSDTFEYIKESNIRLRYFDGCFHPFVVEVGQPLPSFV